MNKQTEALKLALEALEYISSHYMSLPKIGCMALAAVEEALAEQPVKEKAPQSANCEAPGWISSDHARESDCTTKQPYPDNFIHALMYDVAKRDSEAQQQEPVAWIHPNWPNYTGLQSPVTTYMVNDWVPLYTSPQPSKPLTDEQIVQIELGLRQYNNRDTYDLSLKDFARAIEAAHGIKENKK